MNRNIKSIFIPLVIGLVTISCGSSTKEEKAPKVEKEVVVKKMKKSMDKRISLELNAMQKNHQLKNMRSHLEAIQSIISLLGADNFDEAAVVAYEQLGSTTEMKLMCASFGNEEFENLGLDFHSSADEMSEIFKKKDKDQALDALSKTMNYCVQCHATFRQ